jgi:quaternary ammonium compound-resistance protein SugE
LNIYWLSLLLAGFLEIGWPLGLKLADLPNMKIWGIVLALISMTLSGLLLWFSLKEIPIGTAYAVWTGIGAVGTVLVGIFIFKEPADFWRVFFIVTLITSIVGLKAVSH